MVNTKTMKKPITFTLIYSLGATVIDLKCRIRMVFTFNCIAFTFNCIAFTFDYLTFTFDSVMHVQVTHLLTNIIKQMRDGLLI